MTENQKKILEMLSKNKISVDDAYRLLNVIDSEEGGQENTVKAEPDVKSKPKYLRVTILPGNENSGNADRVNVRVPMSLIRAGMKLTSLIPSDAMDKVNDTLQDKGITFDMRSINTANIEELIEALSDTEVDVVSRKGEKVRIFVE